jgi:leader peptidase (prepilin peptidase) / N-methyltransferase
VQILGVVLLGLVGLVLGSFANVPIQRWPAGGTVTVPRRSVCPSCETPIRPLDNLPVVSWLVLRGRCRHCGAAISPRYLVVELATGILFASTVAVWGLDPLVPALLVFVWALVVATAIDLEHRIIPNRLTYRLPLVLVPLLVLAAAALGAWSDLWRALIAGVALPAVMLLLSEAFRFVRGQPGIGMGDIKLAVSIGLVVGYLGGVELVVFAYASVISAVVIALALVVAGRAKLASRIPFGPYLAVGSLVPVLFGGPATDLALRIVGL